MLPADDKTISRAGPDAPDPGRRLAMLEHAEEIAGIGSWDWDVRGGGIHWSDNLFRIFGLAPGAITPSIEYVLERTHADDQERLRRAIHAMPEQGRGERVEYRFVHRDGSTRRLLATVGEVEHSRGGGRRLVGTIQDVTERRQTARELAGHIALEEAIGTQVSFDGGAERLLAGLGGALGFDVGVLTVRRDGHLESHSRWSSVARDVGAIETAKRPLEEGPGTALAVAAWVSATPVVIVDIADAAPFRGRDIALRLGMRSAVAVPAVARGRSLAILEFYAGETLAPTETLVPSLAGMGHELGHFFERRPGELRRQALSPREREILELAAEGLSGKLIASRLALSPSTVKTHFEHIYSKLGVPDRASAVAKGLREGAIA